MPGHPRCSDEDTTLDPASDHEEVESPSGSIDSLLSEICDDPASTLCIPDAVIRSPLNSRSPSPPHLAPRFDGVEETDSGIVQDQDAEEIFDVSRTSSGSRSSLCEDDISEQWCPTLYMLQRQAPKPRCLHCSYKVENRPPQYGMEYHGVQSKEEALELLGSVDGSYLVRATERGHHILSFVVDRRMYNYRLFHDEGLHFVGEKKFDNLEELVEDGLITLYLQKHGVVQAMEEGRHNTLARRKTQKKLKRKHGKRVKGLKGKAAWDYQRSKSSNSTSHSPSPSPVVSPGPIPSRDIHNLILNSELDVTSQSAPHTPIQLVSEVTPNSNSDQSDLDFPTGLRLSTPNLCITANTPPGSDTCELRLPKTIEAVSKSSPLAQRRARSTSSIQKDASLVKGDRESEETFKDKRYSAIFSTLRDVVKEERFLHSKSMDGRFLKTYSSDSTLPGHMTRSLADDIGIGTRSYSCSGNKAFTLSSARVRDVALHGSTTLNRRSLVALAKHTTGPTSVYFKAHKFDMHSYKCPTWCEICHHFLWGLKQQGMRCQDCGMDIHKQCLPVAMQLECFPNKQFIKKVFGVDLTTVVKLEGGLIPSILSRCFDELQSRDLSVPGVYRLSGQSSEIMELKEKFNQGEVVNLSRYSDINIITGVIKLYLRELPIPLITFDTYKEIMKCTVAIDDLDDPSTDLSLLSDALKLLPKPHYNTLKHLAQHLSHVESHSNDNKMSARNLAVVFAPTLMRAPSDDTILVQDLPVQKYFVECVILKHDILFR